MTLNEMRVLFTPAAIAGSIALLIFAACDKSSRKYSAIWTFIVLTGTALWASIFASYLATAHFNPNPGHSSPDSGWISGSQLLQFAALIFLLLPTFPITIAAALFPPSKYRLWTRVTARVALTIPLLILFSMAVQRNLEVGRLNVQRSEAIRSKEAQEADWRTPRPPDPEVGPIRWGEWYWLGGNATYGKYGNQNPADPVVEVSFGPLRGGPAFNPDAFKWLKSTKTLESLSFNGIVTDDYCSQIADIAWLKRLSLIDTAVTDNGLKALTRLAELEQLNMEGSQISDQGLEIITEFPALRFVRLEATRVTIDGLFSFAGRHDSSWKVDGQFKNLIRKDGN